MNRLFHRILIENYKLKIASLVIAALVWLYVQNMGTVEKTLEASLRLRTPDGFVVIRDQKILGDEPITLTLKLKGPRATLEALGDLEGTCDLGGPGFGLQTLESARPVPVPLLPRFFKLGSGYAIVEPTQEIVTVDRLLTKELQLTEPRIENVPPGYELGSITYDPHVEVLGPSSVLATAEEAEMDPIRVTGLMLDQSVNLQEVLVKGMRLKTKHLILVTYRLEQQRQSRVIEGVPLLYKLPPSSVARIGFTDQDGHAIETIAIEIDGPPETVGELSAELISACVDLRPIAHLQTDKVQVRVEVDGLPDGVHLVRTIPDSVQVSITPEPSGEGENAHGP
ncbi:MAG: hypothetical protein JXA57_16350 [Armatimonadetes bacterium]|nr:hypothetical protein [Armatimonadota bacterium]